MLFQCVDMGLVSIHAIAEFIRRHANVFAGAVLTVDPVYNVAFAHVRYRIFSITIQLPHCVVVAV